LRDTKGYTPRDLELGVPAVEEVMGFTANERMRRTGEIVTYLSHCDEEEILSAGERVVGLYSRSSTVSARFDTTSVDVYARAALARLEVLGTGIALQQVNKINESRRIVGAQKGKNLQRL